MVEVISLSIERRLKADIIALYKSKLFLIEKKYLLLTYLIHR